MWRHPEMTAAELSELLPGRTPKAVSRIRERYGRYRRDGVVPLCQKCGEHPVWSESADGRRWGLCKACTLDERDYLARRGGPMARRDNAQRQARFKKAHRKRGR